MKTLLMLFWLTSSMAHASVAPTIDPLAYATESSLAFAEGDVNDNAGWRGCEEQSEPDAVTRRISCVGTRSVLIFGGRSEEVTFECAYDFEKVLGSPTVRYAVRAEDCE